MFVSGPQGSGKIKRKQDHEELSSEEIATLAEGTLNTTLGKLKAAGQTTIRSTKQILSLIKELID
jgi:hypothetical protein